MHSKIFSSTSSNPQLSALLKEFREQPTTREHYKYNGRNPFSRRARYLLMFLEKHMPENDLKVLEDMFASETHRMQNWLATQLFAYLIGSRRIVLVNNPRLLDKLTTMMDVINAVAGQL